MRIKTRALAIAAALSGAAMSVALLGPPAVAAGPYVPYGAIGAEWKAKGAASGFLGAPTSFEYDVPGVPGARVEEFVGGQIYWSPATGAHEVHGAILAEYLTPAGSTSFLGLPLTDETPTPDGVGRFNNFQGGSIYWHPNLGAHEVHGAVLGEYRSLGGPSSFLGLPLTDETTTPDGVGRFNHFQGGSIYWTPATGAHAVYGAIRENWSVGGRERGPLGYPTTDEFAIGGGAFAVGGGARQQGFTRGQEYWSSVTGAHEVHGAILAKYLSLGSAYSFLGLPLTDETSDGVGRFNDFQGGSIYWTPGTGSQEVGGAILDKYRHLGGPGSFLGLPLTDEMTTPDGIGQFNHFQGGSIYWTPGTGAHEVHGDIRAAWAASGWELGPLGYPTSDEFSAASIRGRQSNFQHGSVIWANGVSSIHVL